MWCLRQLRFRLPEQSKYAQCSFRPVDRIRITYIIGLILSFGGGALVQKRVELAVGAKGEIYTTEEVRRAVGIEPPSVVVAEVGEGQLILRPKESGEHLLEKPRFEVPPISPKQLSKLRRKLAKDLGER